MLLFQSLKDGNEFMQHIYRDVLHPKLAQRLRQEYEFVASANYGTFSERCGLEG